MSDDNTEEDGLKMHLNPITRGLLSIFSFNLEDLGHNMAFIGSSSISFNGMDRLQFNSFIVRVQIFRLIKREINCLVD